MKRFRPPLPSARSATNRGGWPWSSTSLAACCVLALSALSVRAPAARAEAEALPTQEEIHQLFDQQKYPQVLQKLARVLILKGPAARAYDRHDLLRLKGETQLRLKSASAAEQAFAEAAKEAPDANAAAFDTATGLLIRRSPAGQYVPRVRDKNKPAGAFSVLDADQRKLALSALFRDELAAASPRIKAVREARSLTPIMDLMPTIASLRTLESAASDGKTEETKKLIADLAKHAQDLMGDAVQGMAKQVDALDKYANEMLENDKLTQDPLTGNVRREPRWRKRGLQPRDEASLRDLEGTCDKIIPASRELADALGTDAAGLDAVRTAAEKVGRKADQVLHADYRGEYLNPNGQ